MKVTAILLAAGQGTRMRSDLPKVLHPIAGKPMIWHALQAVKHFTDEKPVGVIGHGAEQVTAYLGDSAQTVLQEPQLGTGHAAMQAEAALKGKSDLVVVCYADMPLLRGATLQKLVETQERNKGPLSMLTAISEAPRGFGRVIRRTDGTVQAVVEEYVATPEQLQVRELNVGGYCFPSKGEYYLTDIVEIAAKDGLPVGSIAVDDLDETIGINTRVHLAEVEAAMRLRINREHMLNGVTLTDPASTYIEAGVKIGGDTIIQPNTYLRGATEIGAGNVLGPNTIVQDSKTGRGCKVFASVLEGALLEDDVDMGPFAHLRKGAHLGNHVHMGNFGEVKDSYLADGVKMGHFSYIGDAQIGAHTNIGAGTITCNYDGERKHETQIGENVFIGSDTMLVAPLTIGSGARTGAGSVVTKNVAADTLVVGMPARAIKKVERKAKKK